MTEVTSSEIGASDSDYEIVSLSTHKGLWILKMRPRLQDSPVFRIVVVFQSSLVVAFQSSLVVIFQSSLVVVLESDHYHPILPKQRPRRQEPHCITAILNNISSIMRWILQKTNALMIEAFPELDNFKEIQERLLQRRLSLSPSRFTDQDFKNFRRRRRARRGD